MSTQEAPTQVRFTGRTMARTFFQTVIPAVATLALVVPLVLEAVIRGVGPILSPETRAWLAGLGVAVAAVAATISRVMAIPAVEAFLRRHRAVSGLAAEPTPVPPVDVDPEAGYAVGGYIASNPGFGIVRRNFVAQDQDSLESGVYQAREHLQGGNL